MKKAPPKQGQLCPCCFFSDQGITLDAIINDGRTFLPQVFSPAFLPCDPVEMLSGGVDVTEAEDFNALGVADICRATGVSPCVVVYYICCRRCTGVTPGTAE